MKWFSIDTNLINDDKIEDLLFRHGAEGYAVYVHLLERIAKEIDIDNKNNGYINGVETIGRLAHGLYIQPENMEEILNTCAKLNLIDPKEWKNKRIYIPKLLSRKQITEYLRSQKAGKKGAKKRWEDDTPNSPPIDTPKSTPNDYIELDKEIDLDKELDKEVGTKSIVKEKRNINSKRKIKLHSCEERRSLVKSNPDIEICEHFLFYLKEYHPNKVNSVCRNKQDWEIYETWLNDIRLLYNKGYKRDQILTTMEYAINDNFWRGNFFSISKLNKKDKEGVLYIAKFLDKIKNESKNEITKESLLEMMQ